MDADEVWNSNWICELMTTEFGGNDTHWLIFTLCFSSSNEIHNRIPPVQLNFSIVIHEPDHCTPLNSMNAPMTWGRFRQINTYVRQNRGIHEQSSSYLITMGSYKIAHRWYWKVNSANSNVHLLWLQILRWPKLNGAMPWQKRVKCMHSKSKSTLWKCWFVFNSIQRPFTIDL